MRRLDLDGTIDPDFSEITMVFNNAFAVASDDSFYIGTRDTTNGIVYELHHFNPNGTCDTGFNAGNPMITSPIQPGGVPFKRGISASSRAFRSVPSLYKRPSPFPHPPDS